MKRNHNALLHSLAFKMGAVIVLAQMVVSAIAGVFNIINFNAQIDRRTIDNVLRPAALMNQGILKFEMIADGKRMRVLVGEEPINAFIIGLNGKIFFSLNNAYNGLFISSVPQVDASLLNPGLSRPLVRQNEPEGHISALAPLFDADGRSLRFFYYIEAASAVSADQKRNHMRLFVLGALSMTVLTSIVILAAFNLAIFSPLRHLLGALKQVEGGDLSARLAAAGARDELGQLSRGFNRLAARQRETLGTLHQFLESMHSVNRAIRENKDIEQMLGDVLDVVISIFECDGASLVYPCDPEAAVWQTVLERTRQEYPGVFALKAEIPMAPGDAKVYQAVLASSEPATFGTGNEYPLPADVAGRFPDHLRLASQLATAIYPRQDKPYLFVIHQCARPRIWTQEEKKLFKKIGGCLEDALMTGERKQMEKALSASEAELRTLVKAMTDVIIVCNAQGRYLKIVDTSSSLLYKPQNELLGKTLHEVFCKDVADFFLDHVKHALKTRQSVNFEYKLPIEMKEFWFHATISPLNADEIVLVARDITDRKQAEEKLQIFEERMRLTMEATQIGIFDWDVEHDIWYASPEYYTVLGYEPEEGRGDRQQWLERVHPDDRDHVEAKIREVLAITCAADQDQTYEYEARLRHADGCYRWQHVKGLGVRRNHQGQVTRLMGIRMDVNDRKKTEEALHRLNSELDQRVLERTAQLETANKELESFAYSVSHDLRAPLRHIDGFLHLLEKTSENALDGQGRQYMTIISEAARKMGRLIDDLLSFSRMGRHALSVKLVALKPLVRGIIREFEPDTAGRTIDWHIGDLPEVSADAAMLRVALSNLISNALKFTRPRQQARIEIGALPGQDPEIVICVRDNGVGFDMTYAEKLFGVFQRLHRSEEFEGTGIGLANVRRIIARHGGQTWAEGEVGQGAAFYFSLPRSIMEET